MRGRWILVAAVAFLSQAAAAETCKQQVAAFAEEHRLAAELPSSENLGATGVEAPPTLESRGFTTDEAANPIGAVERPDQDAETARVPARSESRREIAPDDRPEATPEASAGSSGDVGAAKRERVESLLLGATSAAEEGNEVECADLLRQAKEAL